MKCESCTHKRICKYKEVLEHADKLLFQVLQKAKGEGINLETFPSSIKVECTEFKREAL